MGSSVAPNRVPVIGLLGGVASGKSAVARMFAEWGAAVLDADRAGHEVLRQPEVERAIRERWGERVFDAAGRVDRPRVAAIVFASAPDGPAELAWLERLTHPRIGKLLELEIERLAGQDVPAVVLDAPVLDKAGWDRLCDVLVFVDAPRAVRLGRALQRGWTAEEFGRREAAQPPVDQRRTRADHVIDNSGEIEQTRERAAQVWQAIAKKI